MRPNAEELAVMSPEFDQRWSSYFANAPDKPVMLYALYAAQVLWPPALRFKINSLSGVQARTPQFPVANISALRTFRWGIKHTLVEIAV